MTDEAELSLKRQARRELKEIVKLLKRARVSQNTIARTAGYTPGYVTQLLGDNYPVDKLSAPAIASLTKAASSHARNLSGLSSDQTQHLDRLLQELSARYGADAPQIFGLDGEFLDRRAENFQYTDADRGLVEDLNDHVSFGVVQVTGAPGQGKTWSLANLALDAQRTHDVCWVDFDLLERPRDLERGALGTVVLELRKAHQRYYRDIVRHQTRGTAQEGAAADALVKHIGDLLTDAGVLDPPAIARLDQIKEEFDRVLTEERIAALPRPSVVGIAHDEDEASAIAYLRAIPEQYYAVDDLADELCLLVALADARALVRAARAAEAPGLEARKLLLLIDGPDRTDGADTLLQTIRELQPIAPDNPGLRSVLIVVAKTQRTSPNARTSSVVRRWAGVGPFMARPKDDGESDELLGLIEVLLEHGWLPKDWEPATLVARCEELGGRNRRVTCLYLDHCRRTQELCTLDEYLSAEGDPRVPAWVGSWAVRVARGLVAAEPYVADNVKAWLSSVADASDGRSSIEIQPPVGVKALVETFGLVAGPEVPRIQQLVCQRTLSILEEWQDVPRNDASRVEIPVATTTADEGKRRPIGDAA